MRLRRRFFAIVIAGPATLAATLAVTVSGPDAQSRSPGPWKIAISAQPIDVFNRGEPERRRFGALEFRGGLILTSAEERFGGISGIRLAPNGERFLAITDRGYWLRGSLTIDGDKPVGIANAEMAPMLAAGGGTLEGRGWFDTEAIAADGQTFYIGVERANRILRFDVGKGGLLAPGQLVTAPAAIRTLPHNQGIEGMAYVPKGRPLAGTLIAISERGLDKAGNIRAFLIGGATPGEFALRRIGDFDITDAALIPGGDLLVLERRFSFLSGLGMRIRLIRLADIKPGAVVDGPVLIEAGNAHEIDNMEGLAAHTNTAGETIVTIVSDDNFSRLQRTLLLRFALIED